MTACSPSRDPAVRCIYTRRQLLGLRCVPGSKSKMYVNEVAIHGLLRYRGNRAGRVTHRRQDCASVYKHDPDSQPGSIQTVHSRRQYGSRDQQRHSLCADRGPNRPDSTLVSVSIQTPPAARPTQLNAVVGPDELTPSLYIINAAALSKPGAIDHLTVDLKSYGISVAIVTAVSYTHLTLPTIYSV